MQITTRFEANGKHSVYYIVYSARQPLSFVLRCEIRTVPPAYVQPEGSGISKEVG
jgi:hypothetical protein